MALGVLLSMMPAHSYPRISIRIGIALLATASLSPAQQPAPAAKVNFPEVTDVDHAALIRAWDDQAFERGKKLYQTVCFACRPGLRTRQEALPNRLLRLPRH